MRRPPRRRISLIAALAAMAGVASVGMLYLAIGTAAPSSLAAPPRALPPFMRARAMKQAPPVGAVPSNARDASPIESSPIQPAVGSVASVVAPRPTSLLMGQASGLPLHAVQVFVQSARAAMPDARIVLFVNATNGVPEDLRQLLGDFAVEEKLYNPAMDLPPFARAYHPSSARWLLMRDYMASLSPPPAAVMFADVRDTVFQRDPFVDMWAHLFGSGAASTGGFFAFQEAAPKTIAQCGWNRGWVKDCFGAGVLREVARNVISCSGTSMATWAQGLAYVRRMAQEIEGNKCERNGVDQGMHNVFVYRGDVPDVKLISNEHGWIATAQSMKTVTRNAWGQVLNSDGAVVAVVHQWDRSPELTRQYEGQYVNIPEERRRMK